MAVKKRQNKNTIQNVRVVDKDEGTDDIMCQRFLQAYNVSEGQIRVVCGFRTELSGYTAGGISQGTVSFSDAVATDDFTSFATQYLEYRIRAIRFDIYDVAGVGTVTNYWSTYHTVGTAPNTDFESVMDRPDARVVAPGDGKATLAWVAHSVPEMSFQSTGTSSSLGGLSYYTYSVNALSGTKYIITAKFIIDFRGRK